MKFHGEGDFTNQGEKITKVEHVKFLETCVTSSGENTTEIKARKAMARTTTSNLMNVWKTSDINTRVKVSLAKSLVWSVVVYGCGTCKILGVVCRCLWVCMEVGY